MHRENQHRNCLQVRVLVEEGKAELGCADRWGSTPLDEAMRSGARAVMDYLQVTSLSLFQHAWCATYLTSSKRIRGSLTAVQLFSCTACSRILALPALMGHPMKDLKFPGFRLQVFMQCPLGPGRAHAPGR